MDNGQWTMDNGDSHVSGDGAPNLRFCRVLAVADETFDTDNNSLYQRLLYSAAIASEGRVVLLSETPAFCWFRVFEADAFQLLGIILRDAETVERDTLIADDVGIPIDLDRVHPVSVHSTFGASYEERIRLMQM